MDLKTYRDGGTIEGLVRFGGSLLAVFCGGDIL